MPEISVIVPVYKAENYLRECLDSILSQTFSDLEAILVDDGSPDNSLAICREYAARDDRVTVLHQENRGQAAARNLALSRARGQWVCFVDSDDRIHPKMLEWLYRAVRESGCGVSMCRMLENPVCPADFDEERPEDFTILPVEEETLAGLLDAGEYPGWVACAKLIRREIVEGYPFREGRVYEDNEAVCRWICAAGKIASIPQPLYFYRTNPDSTTKRQFTEKKLDYLWALESILGFYGELGWKQVQSRFLDKYVEAAAGCYYGAKRVLNRPALAGQVERQTRRFLKKEKLSLTDAQRELLLDTMHPRLIRLYWPVAGAVRTFRREGLGGCFRKAAKMLGGKKQ